MILIISDKHDIHPLKVESILQSNSAQYIRFDIDIESLKSTSVKFDGENWEIECPNGRFNTSEISTVWNRRTYVELLLDELNNNNPGFKIWKGEWNKTLLGIYSELETQKWLNFYRDSYYAENKYRQYKIAKAHGFMIPAFVCSNDKDFLIKSFNNGSEKVIKFMNQDFYKIADEGYKGIYVNKVELKDLNKFNGKEENPVILQNYIPKDFEVRYTVVGDKHFVCKIDSQQSQIASIDWRRYDLANTPHSVIEPPAYIREQVESFMLELKLNYGALDFIVSSNKEWFFLELNSMGQFLWIEDLTGLEISSHIAKWLINNN